MSAARALLLAAALLAAARARTITQRWVLSEATVSPDGVPKTVPLVNGRYPGPVLRGRVDDFVVITLVNNLSEPTTLHWHGIKQRKTVWSDGAPAVTQCEVQPGATFVHTFTLDAPGTLWWHSHTAFQKSSLQGPIIVDGDRPDVGPHPDRILLLNDWWHRSGPDQIAGITAPITEYVPLGPPDSIHINGRGLFDCANTDTPCDPNSPDAGPAIIDVEPNSTYRLRVIGAASVSFLNLAIDNHTLEVVEAETQLLQPFSTDFLDVSSGQSYSVLLHTKTEAQLAAVPDNNGLFYIQAQVRHEGPDGGRGLAILRYSVNAGEDAPRRDPPVAPGADDTAWSVAHARRFKARHPVSLPTPSRTLTVLGTSNYKEDGTAGWAANNISHASPQIPLIHQLALGLQSEMDKWLSQPTIPTVYDYTKTVFEQGLSPFAKTGTHVMEFQKNEVVDFVFQNAVHLAGFYDTHPWHLHLHNFWVLGYGDGEETWTPAMTSRYDTSTPVSRNTMNVYPGGWTAVRVKFDNPGFALFHCHINAHLVTGMGFVAKIGEKSDLPPVTHHSQLCLNQLSDWL